LRSIAIFTTSGDLHASRVADLLIDSGIRPSLVFTDLLSQKHRFVLVPGGDAYFTDIDGRTIKFGDELLVWWRRYAVTQPKLNFEHEEHRKMADQDWSTFFSGLGSFDRSTKWISSPTATRMASNKIFQLRLASKLDFLTPKTIVSNQIETVGKLGDDNSLIIKVLTGTVETPIFASDFSYVGVDDKQFSISPSLIQQKIEAKFHFRVNAFGDNFVCFRVFSDRMDWRPSPRLVELCDIDEGIKKFCGDFLAKADLAMGIFDFVVSHNDEVYFLECNPQGQFLFLEGYTGWPIAKSFSDYLICEASC